MPRHRYDSYDDERAYEKWCEYREQQEEEERQEAWEAEVDEHCECVYEPDKEHYRYYGWEMKPLEICTWHADRAASAAAEETAWREAQAVAAAEKAAYLAGLAERIGIALPAGYTNAHAILPDIAESHPWRDQILYMRERLYLLQGSGLPEELRVALIGDVFEFLSQPENVGLVQSNAKFRAVVEAKLVEFRGDARAESIRESLESMETLLTA